MDDANYFLGMKIVRNRKKRHLYLSQTAYVDKVCSKFNMHGTKSETPMRCDERLDKDFTVKSENEITKPYRELIGSLMYVACTSRPDIMYPTAYLAHYVSCFGNEHWIAAKRVLKYLSWTKHYGIHYGRTKDEIVGYTDADWAGDHIERKSTGGFAFMYTGAVFAWSSKRQSIVAASSMEAEYISQARCVKEALWVRKLMDDFGMHESTVEIRADNQGAIANAKGVKMNNASKHIGVCYHLQRDYVEKGAVRVEYVPSTMMVADGMTKALPKDKHFSNREMYGLVDLNAGSLREGVLD